MIPPCAVGLVDSNPLTSWCWRCRRAALAVAAVLLQSISSTAGSADVPPQPNIIWIMADDLGFGDLGCFGQEQIQTPRLDRMADEGMKFTSFYAGCTVCRPSRLVLWTGQHTGHTAINSNTTYIFQQSDTTVAGLLKQAGYATGGVGKWAMGGVESSGHPNQQGFDFWMGYLDQGDAHNYYPTHLWRNTDQVPLVGNVLGGSPQGRGRVSIQRETYSHDVMTEEALEFVRRSADRPFLLHIHWTIPHANNEGGRVTGDGMEVPAYGMYADRDWPNPEKGHAAMVTRMDADVGRLLELLQELEIERQTLVLFTSDNGPHQEGGHQHTFFDSNGPLRGYKRDLYEGGIRVPTIAWWPGVIEPGSVTDEPLAFYDFLPTACELAGIEEVPNRDGISFLPILKGESQPSHEFLYWRYGKKEAVRKSRWKAVRLGPDRAIELYDLEADIGEADNVAAQQTELVHEMESLMRAVSNRQVR